MQRLAVDLYGKVSSGNVVAKRLGVAPSTVYKLLDDAGIVVPSRTDPKPARRKLNESQAEALVAAYKAGDSIAEIQAAFGVGQQAIRKYVKESGAPLRKVGGKKREISSSDVDWMVALYTKERLSRKQIASAFGCHEGTVSRYLRARGFVVEQRASGAAHGSWNGGLTVTQDGYVKEKVALSDPFRSMGGAKGYVPQHRLVMARALGRALDRSETVHHINGNRSDNRIQNLQLRRGKHGKGSCFVCSECGSHNIVEKEID